MVIERGPWPLVAIVAIMMAMHYSHAEAALQGEPANLPTAGDASLATAPETTEDVKPIQYVEAAGGLVSAATFPSLRCKVPGCLACSAWTTCRTCKGPNYAPSRIGDGLCWCAPGYGSYVKSPGAVSHPAFQVPAVYSRGHLALSFSLVSACPT